MVGAGACRRQTIDTPSPFLPSPPTHAEALRCARWLPRWGRGHVTQGCSCSSSSSFPLLLFAVVVVIVVVADVVSGIDAAVAWNSGPSERVCQLQIAAFSLVWCRPPVPRRLAENKLSKGHSGFLLFCVFLLFAFFNLDQQKRSDYLASSGFHFDTALPVF